MKRDDLLETIKTDKDERAEQGMKRPLPGGEMIGGAEGNAAPQGNAVTPAQVPPQDAAQQEQGGGGIGGKEIFDMIANRAFGVRPYASIENRNIARRRDAREQAVFDFNQRTARKGERLNDAARDIAPKLQAIANPTSYYHNNLNHLQDVLNKNMDFFGGQYEITDSGEKKGEEKLWNITIKDPDTGKTISQLKETTTGAIDSFQAVMTPEESLAMQNEIKKTYMQQQQTLKTARSMSNASVIEKRIFGIPTTELEEAMYNFKQLEETMPESPLWMRREASGMKKFMPDKFDYMGGGPVQDSSGKWGVLAKDRADNNTVKIVPIKGLTGGAKVSAAAAKHVDDMKLKQAKYFREGAEGFSKKQVPGIGGGVKEVVDETKREWLTRIYDALNPGVSSQGFSGTNPEFHKIDQELAKASSIYDTASLKTRDELLARQGEGADAIDVEKVMLAFGSLENYETYVLQRHISDMIQGIVRPKLSDSPNAHLEYLQKLSPEEQGIYLSMLPENTYGAVKAAYAYATTPKPKKMGDAGGASGGYAPSADISRPPRRARDVRGPVVGGVDRSGMDIGGITTEETGAFGEALRQEQETIFDVGGAKKKKKEDFRGL